MKIAIPKERRTGEKRVAASPDVVKKLVALGFDVIVEKGAGVGAAIEDAAFKDAGATIAKDAATALKDADVVLKIQRPIVEGDANELALMKKGAVLIAHLGALAHQEDVKVYATQGITAFAMELMPRISRAQSMDILSSQSNLAGYKAVLDGAAEYGSAFPMMMTAAGTIAPAKVFVMGVGVAGLQAIATAKRLGAVVTATDVRPATREQVESLGGKFLTVDAEMEKDAETEGGYAKQMPPEYFEKQKAVVAEHIKKQNIVITTALIPGRPAPELVSADMVASMAAGSVIVDLAVEAGGNCALAKPGKVVTSKNGVKIVGHENMPSRLPKDSSVLFAKNLLNFLTPHVDRENKTIAFDWEDETVGGTCVVRDGQIVHPLLSGEGK
ncbi:Re/Si-specific NAD(P)(+) transhydrogenase subunit alpha [Varunaivibrio sulfuroxidans]|uniref:NAD(P) transhydrogenase subunit alpha part 1 n=1 Tax=Varunaivibrio sulfuroxidans TaxID=1773489 RepID=A0A4R3JBI0_9PROT|nr:Re/Si-specific NAD(P)(+) transhydrogenase subunit alpha [Varunaivibrio sulfuroxidans]TCS63062.1 NAD(P) transhydrogenase subunit alpha [Varunaivibrio sulfuroxidans]WES31866.1 Re/Si-specific NAD(P)(+) transhydrogenase subunit alpha [Varunaivibrio sulfuroxidans]